MVDPKNDGVVEAGLQEFQQRGFINLEVFGPAAGWEKCQTGFVASQLQHFTPSNLRGLDRNVSAVREGNLGFQEGGWSFQYQANLRAVKRIDHHAGAPP